MAHNNNSVIGYGIIDTHEPMYLGKGGYGFLIRQSDRESVEELQEWHTRVTREYPLAIPTLKFVTCYHDGVPESAIKDELESRLLPLDTPLREAEELGYNIVSWKKLRRRLEEDKSLEEWHRSMGGSDYDYEPISALVM
jgi:hypothetical protein